MFPNCLVYLSQTNPSSAGNAANGEHLQGTVKEPSSLPDDTGLACWLQPATLAEMPGSSCQRSFSQVDLSNVLTADERLKEYYMIFVNAAIADNSVRLRNLAERVNTLRKCLYRLTISLQQTNRPFEGYDEFEQALRECDLFIRCFQPKKAGFKWDFNDNYGENLEAQIMMQISLISTSTIVLLAETFFSNDDREPGSFQPIPQLINFGRQKENPDPEIKSFEEFWGKIKRVMYQRKRKALPNPSSKEKESGSVTTFENLEKEIKHDLRQQMLNHAPPIPEPGVSRKYEVLGDQAQVPLNLDALPDEKLLERTQQRERFLRSAVGQHPFPSQAQKPPFSSPRRVWTLPDDGIISPPPMTPMTPLMQKTRLFFSCRTRRYVTLKKSRTFKLSTIEAFIVEKSRKIRCKGVDEVDEAITLEHELPSKSKGRRHPTTNHEMEDPDPSKVYFLDALRVELTKRGETTAKNTVITYRFPHPSDLKLFQELIREKELLKTYSPNKITSSKGQETSFQHLKLWKDDKTTEYTYTFCRNVSGDSAYAEFPLSKLQLNEKPKQKSNRIIQLDFVSDLYPPKGYPHALSPPNSFSKPKKRNSVSSLGSNISENTISQLKKMTTLAESMQFLLIEFKTSTDAKAFTDKFKDVHKILSAEYARDPFEYINRVPTDKSLLGNFGSNNSSFTNFSLLPDAMMSGPSSNSQSQVTTPPGSPRSDPRPVASPPASPRFLERRMDTISEPPPETHIANQDITKSTIAYTVGWICAIQIEMSAALAMLERRHKHPLDLDPTDLNAYAFGEIGSFNVVIGCLPFGIPGNSSSASVGTRMMSSFPKINIGLMVGVGGGVPSSNHDIRLGDVVVSKPGPFGGGVVQYDMGKMTSGGIFQRTGALPPPPRRLLGAVSLLEAFRDNDGYNHKMAEYLEIFRTGHLAERMRFTKPPQDQDELFAADYDHIEGQPTCALCDRDYLVRRKVRDEFPVVHYGTIASGNQVMKDAKKRDEVAKDFDVLCFEMEAAGLMNIDTFPCLVIRGICDYADTHKNKDWQGYAASTAAAYTKELLKSME
ncbi:hypothetical protein G7Y89_g7028 [Cudoniella acicularis]|uniref:Nucleoside phosphorylase domain-containing protein n=1 Tax=Cudoniella acicularis TaxID=354080 RepID=A0A8H4RK52_9HELO|nr:hypothetical protein G7Y89_g7028 [Cudoniella acicularis]